jgi:hypothetical protein
MDDGESAVEDVIEETQRKDGESSTSEAHIQTDSSITVVMALESARAWHAWQSGASAVTEGDWHDEVHLFASDAQSDM